MRQQIIPGATIDCLTHDEAVELLQAAFKEASEERVRAAATVTLDANGNGEDDVYSPPLGFEFEARRVSIDIASAADPNTAQVPLGLTSTQNGASNTGAAAAIAAVLTPGSAAGTQFITGFQVTGAGATAGSVIVVTLTGVQGGTQSFDVVIPAGVGTSITPLQVSFPTPLQATGPNTSITVNVPSFGAGNTNAAVSAQGFWTVTSGKTVEYLRGVGGTRIEWGQPQYGPAVQVPGVQTWGDEQGPYIRNGETFAVRARGLTANVTLDVTVEGILRKPAKMDTAYVPGRQPDRRGGVRTTAFENGQRRRPENRPNA